MQKHLAAVAILAISLTACGDAVPLATAPPPTNPLAATTTTATDPIGPDGTEGGVGSPARMPGEFEFGWAGGATTGELRLADNGCWYVDLIGLELLVVFPHGFEIPFPDDTTVVVGPDGTRYRSGSRIDGDVHIVPEADIPGGTAGRWGNYFAFCAPGEPALAVFDHVEPAFEPGALSGAELAAMASGAEFTVSWPCGRGWAVSTIDERVGIFIYEADEDAEIVNGTLSLPNPSWTAEVVIGSFLFTNHCDDVMEFWEPNPIVAARSSIEAGTLAVIDAIPGPSDPPSLVRATLSGAQVEVGGEVITLPELELENRSFNFFAG